MAGLAPAMAGGVDLGWVPAGWLANASLASGWRWWGWFAVLVVGGEARDKLRWLIGLLGILWGVRLILEIWRTFMSRPFRQMLYRGDPKLFEYHSGYTSIALGFALGWGEQTPKVEALLTLIVGSLWFWKAILVVAGAGQIWLARRGSRNGRAIWAAVMLGQWGSLLATYLLAAVGYGEISLMFPAIFGPLLVTTWLTVFMLKRKDWGRDRDWNEPEPAD